MATVNIPKLSISGNLFDVYKCNIACPCIFVQTPSYGGGTVIGVLAYHIYDSNYGETVLDGLNLLTLASFEGDICLGNTKANITIFFDEQSTNKRGSLEMIFSGKAGGFMAQFAKLIGEHRGINFASI